MTRALSATVMLILLAASPIRAEVEAEPVDFAALRAQQQQQLEQEARQLPNLGTHPIDRVVSFRIDPPDLIAQTYLPANQPRGRITVPGLDGWTTIQVHSRPHNWPDDMAPPFQFIHQSISLTDLVKTQISVFTAPGFVILSHDLESPEITQTVQLLQNFRQTDGFVPLAEDPVRLYVQTLDPATDDAPVNLSLSAESFEALRRNHPREVDQYLQPIFRELRAEALLSVDPRLAWQVFADHFRPDPQLSEQLETILAGLDAESFQQRQAASEALQSLGQSAALALMAMDRSGLSPEQDTRIDAFLRDYRPLNPDHLQRLHRDPAFLLGVMMLDERALRQAAFEQLQTLHDSPLEFDPDAATETRAEQVERLRNQLLPKD